ncbi:MAG TPA: hypothetical protein VF483_01780 [Gemmatimonadaceae bacterium]
MRTTILRTLVGTAAISATAGILPLGAQVIREGARTSPKDVQVSFGYLCDDRFVVRNESDDPLRLEYGLAKNDERTSLSLDGRESVELLLSTSDELDLFSGGKVIAAARREYRDCRDVEDGGGRIVVRPLVVRPTVVVEPYAVYRPYYDPWWYHRPYFRPIVQAVIRVPISIGGHRDSDRGRDRGGDRGRGNDRGGNRGGKDGRRGR